MQKKLETTRVAGKPYLHQTSSPEDNKVLYEQKHVEAVASKPTLLRPINSVFNPSLFVCGMRFHFPTTDRHVVIHQSFSNLGRATRHQSFRFFLCFLRLFFSFLRFLFFLRPLASLSLSEATGVRLSAPLDQHHINR